MNSKFINKLIEENLKEQKKDYTYLKKMPREAIKYCAQKAIKECEKPNLRRIK